MVSEGPLSLDEGPSTPPPLPSFDWYVKSVSLRSSKGSPCVRLKGAHCWVETTLSRNNPVPKEAENVLKKIQGLIVYIGEL